MGTLKDIQPPFENRIEHLREIVRNFEIGQVFLTALELDVFSHLRTPLRGADVAEKLGTRADLTLKFLDILAGMQLLVKKEDQYCTAPAVAPFLDKRSPYYARYLQLKADERSALLKMKDVLHTGPANPPENKTHQFDRDAIDWMARTSLLGRLQATIGHVTHLPEFSRARRIIDLGCGHGLFGIALAQENPRPQVILFDKPEVTPIAQTYIERYGMGERVRVMSGDYTKDDIGTGYDMVFEACSFAGSNSEHRLFFRKIASVLTDGGLFIRLTYTLDDDRTAPLEPLIWELKNHLIGKNRGFARTNAETFQLLSESGLQGEKIIDMSPWCISPMRLIISRKQYNPSPLNIF
jgi:predicted TPR repeat methyltransferase